MEHERYIKVEWPEAQEYMAYAWFLEENYYDPRGNCWFIPEKFELKK